MWYKSLRSIKIKTFIEKNKLHRLLIDKTLHTNKPWSLWFVDWIKLEASCSSSEKIPLILCNIRIYSWETNKKDLKRKMYEELNSLIDKEELNSARGDKKKKTNTAKLIEQSHEKIIEKKKRKKVS